MEPTNIKISETHIFKLVHLNQNQGHKTCVRENKENVKKEQHSGNLT
jgi:hypothetical protein